MCFPNLQQASNGACYAGAIFCAFGLFMYLYVSAVPGSALTYAGAILILASVIYDMLWGDWTATSEVQEQ
jgi:hypothetical protein